MRLVLDTSMGTIQMPDDRTLDLYGQEAFELISDLWLKMSWNQKYSYTFTWLGRPIIQHPEDLVRLQELIFSVRPTVIVETGIAHGGSLILSASLLKAMGVDGRVIGVDVEIRPHNRTAIEDHALFDMITLIEGDAVALETISKVEQHIRPDDAVLVILDSNHSYDHVMKELKAYNRFVTKDSYIVSTDGIMRLVHDVPRGESEWVTDNPANAAEDFAASTTEFVLEQPNWLFNESELDKVITAWPSAWLRRVS
ncbi:MAG: CmcI family methyltransferase [Pseudomonadota bacterium]